MRRRELLAALGGGTWSLAARAQQPGPTKRLGVLTNADDAQWKVERAAFLDELTKRGWTPQNLHVDYRFGGGSVDGIAAAVKEIVSLRPDVILARSTPVVRALLLETRTIPIVFVSASDPIGEKFAASYRRPGGNVTGFTNIEASMSAKWLQLLKTLVPSISNVAVLYNPGVAVLGGNFFLPGIQTAAPGLGVVLHTVPVYTLRDVDAGLTFIAKEPNPGLVVVPDQFIVANRAILIGGAAQRRLPAIYGFRNMVSEGGLMSYGVDLVDIFRRSGEYIDRIFKGAVVGELPIQAPVEFKLTFNRNTALAMSLDIPTEFSDLVDEWI
jgi:putative ABC transport system substrate-binding protein